MCRPSRASSPTTARIPGSTRASAGPPSTDHTEVIVAGGGFGGLLVGARLRRRALPDIRLIDEAGDFGGTWYWNRYPGAMCDIEAHIYLPLLEELNYAPRHRYAYATEMLEQSRRSVGATGFTTRRVFRRPSLQRAGSRMKKKWLVETSRGDRMTATYFVLACGRQSLPKLPGIPGSTSSKAMPFTRAAGTTPTREERRRES